MCIGGRGVCYKTSAKIVCMGAGNGRAWRAAAVSVSVMVGTDYARWESFVSTAGLQNVKVSDYYDIHTVDASFNRHLIFAQDLFADLVAVGAVGLAAGGSVDDFELFFGATPPASGTLYVRRRDGGSRVPVFGGPNLSFLNTDFELGSDSVEGAVKVLLRAVSKLMR